MAEQAMYSKVRKKIWNSQRFRSLSLEARHLFLYIITCPHSNILGMFILRPGYVMDDLQLDSREQFMEPLQELLNERLIDYDFENEIILDMEHLDKNPLDNPNQVKAAIKQLEDLPKSILFKVLVDYIKRLGKPLYEPLAKRLCERFGEPVTVTVTVTEEKKEPVATASKSIPTGEDISLQEVIDRVRVIYPRFNGLYAFVQTHRKDNRKALIHTLSQLLKYHDNGTPVKDPYPFCEKVISNENGKFNARDHESQSEGFKITKGEAQSMGTILGAMIKGKQ